MVKTAIFDMDGTVCNTIDDLADAVNYALNKLGYPLHSVEEYKYFVGNGITMLIYRALPKDKKTDADVAQARELMLDFYRVHFADKTVAYDGIIDLLNKLKEKGIHIACCTNKAHHMAQAVAEKLFCGIFETVIGQTDDRPLKPDPFSVNEIMEKFGTTAGQTVFIGDSGVDMQTAARAGAISIGVTWGFRTEEELKENGAQYIAHAPLDIIKIINNL